MDEQTIMAGMLHNGHTRWWQNVRPVCENPTRERDTWTVVPNRKDKRKATRKAK